MADTGSNTFKTFMVYLWAWRNTIFVFGFAALLLPLCFCFEDDPYMRDPMRCAYVIILMIILWTTESLPLAVTAVIPMVLYPMLSVIKATELAPQYMQESNISFIGSILVIGAFERVGLHKRFALFVLTLVGAKPRWLLAGFMIVSWFLSMWCSNTMTTVLLIPIVISVTGELRIALEAAIEHHRQHHPGGAIEMVVTNIHEGIKGPKDTEAVSVDSHFDEQVTPELKEDYEHHKYENMLLLAIAYSASVGGTATVIGTGPNLIMKSSVESAFDEKGCTAPLSFASWMVFSVPMSFLFLVLMWFWLQVYFCGPKYAFGCRTTALDQHRKRVEKTIHDILLTLPPFDFEQGVVLAHCLAMIVLLITRQLSTTPLIGWELMAPGYVKESTATILAALSLFLFPISLPYRDRKTGKVMPPKTAISWNEAEKSFPFGLLLLIGGGMAAAYGADKSGLASILAKLLNDLVSPLDDMVSLLIMIVFMVFVTEFMSNTACVTLMMPILKELADYRKSNPMLFMFPTALAASFAFMFPVATPPNALVFQTGKFRIVDMITAGFVVNLLGIGVIFMASVTYGAEYFHLLDQPWVAIGVDAKNKTMYSCLY